MSEQYVRRLTYAIKKKIPNATANGIAGIVGNFMQESGCNPAAYEAMSIMRASHEELETRPTAENLLGSWGAFARMYSIPLNEPGYRGSDGQHWIGIGLGQWTGPRCEALWKFAKSKNVKMLSYAAQLDFMASESKWSVFVSVATSNNTPSANVMTFLTQWEGVNIHSSQRIQYAYQYLPIIQSELAHGQVKDSDLGGSVSPSDPGASSPSASDSVIGEITNSADVFEDIKKIMRDVIKVALENFQKQVNIPVYENSPHLISAGVLSIKKISNTRHQVHVNDEWVEQHRNALEVAIIQRVAQEFGKLRTGILPAKHTSSSSPPTPSNSGGEISGNVSEKVKKALAEIRRYGEQKKTIGDGQCYALSGYYAWLVDGKDISYSNRHPMRRLIGDGLNAANIGSGWDWTGWQVINAPIKPSQIVTGAIFNIKPSYGAPFHTIGYGHTGVVTGVGGGIVEVTEQNAWPDNLRTRVTQFDASVLAPACSSIIIPPK